MLQEKTEESYCPSPHHRRRDFSHNTLAHTKAEALRLWVYALRLWVGVRLVFRSETFLAK